MMDQLQKTRIRIGIIGSRRRDTAKDKEATRVVLLDLLKELPGNSEITIVSGGCRVYKKSKNSYVLCGGDRFAEEFAEEYGYEKDIFLPDWKDIDPSKPRKWEAARVLLARNTPIANTVDYLIACVAEDRKGGTEDTIKKFNRRKLDPSRLRLVPLE